MKKFDGRRYLAGQVENTAGSDIRTQLKRMR